MGDRCRGVEEMILEKLKEDKVPGQVANLIISAMRDGELDKAPPKEQPAASPDRDEPPLAYLKGITVEGFRGIGPKVSGICTNRPRPSLSTSQKTASQESRPSPWNGRRAGISTTRGRSSRLC